VFLGAGSEGNAWETGPEPNGRNFAGSGAGKRGGSLLASEDGARDRY
jgi:hypothetical protein